MSYTWARWEEGGYIVHCGCKKATLKEFAKLVKEQHKNNDHAKFYAASIKTMQIVAKMSEAAYLASRKTEKAEGV